MNLSLFRPALMALLLSVCCSVTTAASGGVPPCQARGPLPDAACTPGAVLADITAEQVCTAGYATGARSVTVAEKAARYRDYGLDYPQAAGRYETDHLVPLSLAGSNTAENLWPEAAEPRPGYHEKDRYERFLWRAVCDGRMTLADAQQQFTTDWLANWQAAGMP